MKRRLLHHLHAEEQGQMAILMILTLLVVFMFFALAFDAGLWYFDHRTAQNQSESAALAAVQELPLPIGSEGSATAAGNDWLQRNGFDPCGPGCFAYSDRNDDGKTDTVKVTVARQSDGIFSALSGVDFANISASATATVGPITIANVMPWAVVPPDPDCDPGETCHGDANGDGDFTDQGDCVGDFQTCPWGLNLDNLIAFKEGGGGNTGIIDACGNGASSYRDCIAGEIVSGFFEEGENVVVGIQGGNLGQNTDSALTDRYPNGTPPNDPLWSSCDVESTPLIGTGYDPDGKAAGLARWVTSPVAGCELRLVLIPILASLPPQGGGSASLEVLGVATFGIAKWNRVSSSQSLWGTGTDACRAVAQRLQDPTVNFECGMVWGYLYRDIRPPDFLLQQIGESDNPLAPLLIALID